jgi:FG-GAP repeat
VKNVRVRLLVVVAGTTFFAACSADSETRSDASVKNASAEFAMPGPAPAPPSVALLTTPPDDELVITLPSKSDGAGFGTRVAIQRGMIFASATGVANQSLGAVYSSTYADEWSNPTTVLSGSDWRFGRDMAIDNLNVVASSADTRSALFGWRNGGISIGSAPMNTGLIYSARPVGQYIPSESDWGRAVAISSSYVAASAPSIGLYTTPSPVVVIMSLTDPGADAASVGAEGVATNGSFGVAIDLDDDTLVVGANGTLGGKGSVFVYTRSGTTWSFSQRLDGAAGESFGSDVELVGARMVVGAPGSGLGAAYVCERTGSTWACPVRLDNPDLAATGSPAFGAAVGLSDDGTELIVGAPRGSGDTCCPGLAFTFELRDAAWTFSRTLQSANPSNNDAFGYSVDIDGGVAVVGAPLADPDLGGPASTNAGTVSIFGVPQAAKRAVGFSIDFDSPTVGASTASRLTASGGIATGYLGSIEAWDRSSNRWQLAANTSSGTFSGTWPDASSFYGSLTAYNANGYLTKSLAGSITSPPPTTQPATTQPATTPAPATSAPAEPPTTPLPPSTIAPTGVNAPSVPPVATAPAATAPPATAPTATAPAQGSVSAPTLAPTATGGMAPQPSDPATSPTVATESPATTAAQRTPTTTKTDSRSGGSTPANANANKSPGRPGSAKTAENAAPYATNLDAKCTALQPCSVTVAALSGVDSATVRGAPNGIRFDSRTSTLVGVARKKGVFKVVITGRQNNKTGSVTVNLTVR